MSNDQRSIRAAVEARLAKRHRAEKRFQLYGLGAIGLAVAFLALLLISIIAQSVTAFSAHRITLPVTLEAELVDPRGDGSQESLRAGRYNTVIQNALRAEFPSVEDRTELRELFGLYSAVNAAGLLRDVVETPALVGETIPFTVPLGDDADLYLKGATVEESVRNGAAPLTIALDADGARLSSDAAVFGDFAETVRRAAQGRIDIALQRAAAAEAEAETMVDADEREILLAEAERARALADTLAARVGGEDGLVLGPQTPSLMIRAAGGVFKVERIAPGAAAARASVIVTPGGAPAGPVADWTLWSLETPPAARLITDEQVVWTRTLQERGLIENGFNHWLFTNADSREPELAGILGALIGSILTMIVTMFLAVPIGVGAAIYLEEFAPKNRFTDFIEVNINNLAAVPSIVFGLLGLAVFINAFGMPRSAPVVGGMVLALMTLPTVIISSRAALKAVPPSIREAALGVGASKTQAVFHHVLPLAMPGILTGSIIGLAQALGETAPLLMIGMVAFIADPPSLGVEGFTEPATVMPVQIFLWSTGAERAFEARTAAAILILLSLMILFNAVAIYLRRRFERRW
ncbi:MAG: phosphate ABC transporter permease PstA [Oceanicaulis sp.]